MGIGQVLSAVVFYLLLLISFPFLLIGAVWWIVAVKNSNVWKGERCSGTAYDPLKIRVILDRAGRRAEPAICKIAYHLPVGGRVLIFLCWEMIAYIARLSRYRASFLEYPVHKPTGIQFVNARCQFFDGAIASSLRGFAGTEATPDVDPQQLGDVSAVPVKQVVVLGAGWDSRAFQPPILDAGVRVFEVDLPPTQGAKIHAVERAGLPVQNVAFVSTDFNQTNWLEAIKAKGFDPAQPSFILWEGVTMYLNEVAVVDTLKLVASLAPGTQIAFDYVSKEVVKQQPPFTQWAKKAAKAAEKVYNEHFEFGISTLPKEQAGASVDEFVTPLGLRVVTKDFIPMTAKEDGNYVYGLVLAIRGETEPKGDSSTAPPVGAGAIAESSAV